MHLEIIVNSPSDAALLVWFIYRGFWIAFMVYGPLFMAFLIAPKKGPTP